MVPRPFSPQFGSNQISVLGALGTAQLSVTQDSTTVRIVNSGTGDVYVAAWSSKNPTYVASAKDYRVSAGIDRVIYVGDINDRIALFSVAGTTAEVMTGDGGVV